MSGYKIIGGDGKEYGPVSDLQLRRWIGDGRADRATMIRTEAEGDAPQGSWTALGQIPAFINCFPDENQSAASEPSGNDDVEIIAETQDEPVVTTPINTGEILVGARSLLNKNFMQVAAACFLVWGLMMILNRVPGGWIAAVCLDGPVYGGLYFYLLQLRRGEAATINTAWERVCENFWPLVIAGIVGTIAVRAMSFLIVPGIYFMVAWAVAFVHIADRRSNGLAGLEQSRSLVSPNWFAVAGALIVALLPLLAYHFYVNIKLAIAVYPMLQGQEFNLDKFYTLVMPTIETEVSKSLFITHLLQLATLPLASCVVVEIYERLWGRNRSA